jgi:hypothetical protein
MRVGVAEKVRQDNSDDQYRGFRNNLPALGALALLFFAAKHAYLLAYRTLHPSQPLTDNLHLIPFYAGAALAHLVILHGASALKVLAIAGANYALVRAGRGQVWFPAALWASNIAVLFANDRQHGYTFGALHGALAPLVRCRLCAL